MPPHAAPAPLPVEADDDAFTEDALTEGTPSLVDALVEALVEPPALLADPVESTLPPQPATSLAEAASEKVPTAKRLVLTKEFHDIGGAYHDRLAQTAHVSLRAAAQQAHAFGPDRTRTGEDTFIGLYLDRGVCMRSIRISEDIVPVSDFKARAADWLKRLAETGQPVVITQNGKAAGVLVSPSEFDRMRERAGLLEAIDAGLADEKAGRVVSHAAVVTEMQRRAARRASKR